MNQSARKNSGGVTRIKDIAEKAGVSTGTVDRVIHKRGKVSPKVRDRVLQVISELNYEPNVLARALVSKRNYRIAALIPDPQYDEYWEAPSKGVDMAQEQLRPYGVEVMKHLFDQNDVESFKAEAEALSELGYNGIVVAPLFYRESLSFMRRWSQEGIPFNLFNTHIADYKPLAYIGQDSYQSGVLAGKLLHYGSKGGGTCLIAHVDEDVPNSSHLIRKEQGFMDYFVENGLSQYRSISVDLKGCGDEPSFFRQLDVVFAKYPDINGFFVTNSRAYAIAAYIKKRALKDILLVGYDLLVKNIHYLNEGIIHFLINQNPKGQGFFGVQLMADHLLFNKQVEPIRYLPLDIITKENAQYYI
ncbi:MAG: substrate-binding domain-containing protein [Bacteroidales bacterium]|nr:substrate-binding domain-containing protein [Bacteroidales bacterium]